MKRLGIVLAAGDATRLPNKLLLPQREFELMSSRPIVHSAMSYCEDAGCDKTVVVVRPGGLVEAWLKRFAVDLKHQLDPAGPLSAMQCAFDPAFDEFLVTFGDNVYDRCEAPEGIDCASVREIECGGLDGYSQSGRWVDRQMLPIWKLAGWLLLSRTGFERLHGLTLLEAMNSAQIRPAFCQPCGWWDIGTVEAYKEYLDGDA